MYLLFYIIAQIIIIIAFIIVVNLFVCGSINILVDKDGSEKWSLTANDDLDVLEKRRFVIFRIRRKNIDYNDHNRKEI